MNEGLESLQAQIQKLAARVDENHAMLVSIQHRAHMSILLSGIKWLFIIGITFGSFFFLQPYLDKAFGAYTALESFMTGTKAAEEQAPGLLDIVKTYLPR